MGQVIFQGAAPFELPLQTEPNTTAEGETVVVTLPVFVPGFPQHVAHVRLLLSIPQAEYLAAQLRPAITMAGVNSRLGD